MHLRPYKFSTVFVSPLRRTIETAYYMFREHPNFETMTFVLNPTLREKITVSGDVPIGNSSFVEQIQNIYKPLFN
jgi:hypothetical protein